MELTGTVYVTIIKTTTRTKIGRLLKIRRNTKQKAKEEMMKILKLEKESII